MKLLMIEDNKSVCEMMSMFFEKEKWDVEYAYDGISAVEKFKEKSDEWDMITLDLNLPGMDGMQVNAEIRKISSTVPIIILTTRDSESDQILGLEMGADEYRGTYGTVSGKGNGSEGGHETGGQRPGSEQTGNLSGIAVRKTDCRKMTVRNRMRRLPKTGAVSTGWRLFLLCGCRICACVAASLGGFILWEVYKIAKL